MKLPKQFGGGGFQQALQNAQSAMDRAKNVDAELSEERIEIDKGPIKAVFDGTGLMQSLTIDPEAIDLDDLESIEDLIVGTVRDGFTQATDMRSKKLEEIMPDLPPGLNL
jgi:DNA-binding protein YbaB